MMQTKLQELTEKIYQEGVTKAREEAGHILSEARKEAQQILKIAREEGEAIRVTAIKEAGETRDNSLNELQLSARQAISDLKLELSGLIETKAIAPYTKTIFQDTAFIKELILAVVKSWNPGSGEAIDLEFLLPKSQEQEWKAFLEGKTGQILENKIQLSFSERLKTGFMVAPQDGGYRISFTDEDFNNFFQSYLRPRLVTMLFGDNTK